MLGVNDAAGDVSLREAFAQPKTLIKLFDLTLRRDNERRDCPLV